MANASADVRRDPLTREFTFPLTPIRHYLIKQLVKRVIMRKVPQMAKLMRYDEVNLRQMLANKHEIQTNLPGTGATAPA